MEKKKSSDEEYKRLHEELISCKEIFDGKILHVREDKVKLPNGHIGTREVVWHIGAVCAIPITDEGEIILERQYRYPIDAVITEIPAGKKESPKEPSVEAAKRELMEETGISAREWIPLGYFSPAAAYSSEVIDMYIAKGLDFGERCLDDDEFLDVFKIPLEEAVRQVMEGEITDVKTQLGILKAARFLDDTYKSQ